VPAMMATAVLGWVALTLDSLGVRCPGFASGHAATATTEVRRVRSRVL
jgi:hypothetical protein